MNLNIKCTLLVIVHSTFDTHQYDFISLMGEQQFIQFFNLNLTICIWRLHAVRAYNRTL